MSTVKLYKTIERYGHHVVYENSVLTEQDPLHSLFPLFVHKHKHRHPHTSLTFIAPEGTYISNKSVQERKRAIYKFYP